MHNPAFFIVVIIVFLLLAGDILDGLNFSGMRGGKPIFLAMVFSLSAITLALGPLWALFYAGDRTLGTARDMAA